MCVGCGGCSVRTSGRVPVTIGRFGVYQADISRASADDLTAASRVCPMSDDCPDEDHLAAARFAGQREDPRIGRHLQVLAGRITDDHELQASSSGGLTSWTLQQLLATGLVHGVIHVGRGESSLFEYRISTRVEDILNNRKSQYSSTTMADVLGGIRGDGKKYAIVGVPCFIKAARALSQELPDLGEQLTFFVGLVCGHLKSRFFAESLGWQAGVEPRDLESIDFRVKNPARESNDYDYAVVSHSTGDRAVRSVRSTIDGNWGYGAFQPEACNFCDDIFAETADIVFGDAWLPAYTDDWRGTNVVVTRNETLSTLLRKGAAEGALQLEELSADEAAASQGGNFRHRRAGLQVRLADDIAEGKSVPRKRESPGYASVTRGRVALIRHRRLMSRLSLEAFATARAENELSLYSGPMNSAISTYKLLDSRSRGVVRYAAAKLRGIARRLRPPRG